MRVAPDRLDHSETVGIALRQNSATAATAATVTLYSADGLIAIQEEHSGVIADVPQLGSVVGDDDLTSLTWLQDKNLLKSVHELPKHEFIDDNASDSIVSNSSASSSSSHKSSNQIISMVPRTSYDPQIHVNSKPPFSFSCLIFMAIEDSENKALPVKDIYVWILNNFPYYRNAPTGWKNSVRHNLSLNKCFKKVDKSPNLGKGSLWMVEQRFRPCLIQALQKTPYHNYHKFVRNFSNKKMNVDSIADISDKEPLKNMYKQIESSSNVYLTSNNSESTIPLQTSRTIYTEDNLADDVDAAATAMLVLKHGACAFDIKTENIDFVTKDENSASSVCKPANDNKSTFANCPNDDHNYGYHQYSLGIDEEKNVTNGYWTTTTRSSTYSIKEDIEEQRKIAEGADALLNLAGIKTCNSRKRSLLTTEDQNPTTITIARTVVKQEYTDDTIQFTIPKIVANGNGGGMLLRSDKNTEVNFKESIITVSETDSIGKNACFCTNVRGNNHNSNCNSSNSNYRNYNRSISNSDRNDSNVSFGEKSKRLSRSCLHNGSSKSPRLNKRFKKKKE